MFNMENQIFNFVTLPFIPDGDQPTEQTTTGTPPATTNVAQPTNPIFFDDIDQITTTTASVTTTTTATTATANINSTTASEATAVGETTEPTYVIQSDESVAVVTNETSVASSTTVSNSSSSEGTTVLVETSIGDAESTSLTQASVIETVQVIPTETADYAVESQNNTSFIPWLIGIVVVIFVAAALVVIPKIKKFK